MQDHFGVNQSRFFLAELFSSEAISFQIPGTPIREEHVGILQQPIDRGAVFVGAIQLRRPHSHLDIPGKGFDLRVIGPPDVEYISAVVSEISADTCSGNHMAQSERTNSLQWTLY